MLLFACYAGPMERALDLAQMTQWSEVRKRHSKSRRKSDCNRHKHKSMRCVRKRGKPVRIFPFSNSPFVLVCTGGGHYEDKRDEGAGQGSKTVRTG